MRTIRRGGNLPSENRLQDQSYPAVYAAADDFAVVTSTVPTGSAVVVSRG